MPASVHLLLTAQCLVQHPLLVCGGGVCEVVADEPRLVAAEPIMDVVPERFFVGAETNHRRAGKVLAQFGDLAGAHQVPVADEYLGAPVGEHRAEGGEVEEAKVLVDTGIGPGEAYERQLPEIGEPGPRSL